MHWLLLLEQALLLVVSGGGVAARGALVLEGHGLCWVWLGETHANAPHRGRALGLGAEENSWGDGLGVEICGAEQEPCLLGLGQLALGHRAGLGVVWDTLEQGALLAHWKLRWLLLVLLWRLLLLHGRALLLQLGELSLGLVLKHGNSLRLAVRGLHGGDERQLLLLLLGRRVRGQVQGRPSRLLLRVETAARQNGQRVLEQGGLDLLLLRALGLSQGPGGLKELLWRGRVGWGLCWETGLDGEQLPGLLKQGHGLLLLGGVDLRLKQLRLKLLLQILQHLLLLQLLLLLLLL